MIFVMLLCLGLSLWWAYYGVECFINGAFGGVWMPFRCWWEEFTWNIPIIGKYYRLKFTQGDKEWAKMLPGPIHFGLVCVVLPLLPLLVYYVVRQL